MSAIDFKVGQDEQRAQELGGAGGVGAESGQGPPVLEVGEGVLDRCASDGEARLAVFWPEVGLWVRVAMQPVTITGSGMSFQRPPGASW
ncbi:hypothetical protein AB0F36_16690 [Streptomyces sp. NPDC029080]|uniref:hypothetical protein n=1 Tax=Streptomyces sp. NPDC029080 TaxID=3155017 RepID=UPI0033D96764